MTAPARLRSGLIFQVRVRIIVHQNINAPQLIFDRGRWESMSVNSLVPSPNNQTNSDGRVVLSYNTLTAGHVLVAWRSSR